MGSRGGRLVSFGVVVMMRWLVIGLLVSVAALLLVAGSAAWHVFRRRLLAEESADTESQKVRNPELDKALHLHESTDSKGVPL